MFTGNTNIQDPDLNLASSYQQYVQQDESVNLMISEEISQKDDENSIISEGDGFLAEEFTLTFSHNGQSYSLSRCEKAQILFEDNEDSTLQSHFTKEVSFENNGESIFITQALPGEENKKNDKKLNHALPKMKPEKEFMEKEYYTQNQINLKDCSFSEACSEDVSNPEIFFKVK